MSSAFLPTRPSRQRRYPVAVTFGLIAALLTPAIPAMAAPAPIAGPAALTVAYDALDSVTVSWDVAAPELQTLGYDLTYVDGGGSEKTVALAAVERSIQLTDIGYSASTVSVRARFTDDLVSEPSQAPVLRGSVANLAAATTRTEEATRDTLAEPVTLNSRTALTRAIGAAQTLVANGATPVQVLGANTALNRAAAGLVNYSVVLKYIADYEARDVSGFTPGSRARFALALASTRGLAAAAATDPDAVITPEQIETTVNTLSQAYYAALPVPERLAGLLEQAQSFVAGSTIADYTAYSVRAVHTAIAGANATLADREPTVDTLDTAVQSLQSAMDARTERPSTLRAAFAAYAALGTDRSGFTGASVRDVAGTYAAAVAADDADTGATALSAASTALAAAIAALVRVDTLRDAIAVNNVSLLIPLDYTSTTWAAFAGAYTTSVGLLAQATAADAAPVTEARLAAQAESLRSARLGLAKPAPFSSSGITIAPPGPTPPDAARPPGLYVNVLDGLITLSNNGGSLNFTAGQFGYTPAFRTPPVVLPTNPGLIFTPPPTFSPPTTTIKSPQAAVDCEVRALAVDLGDVAYAETAAPHPTDVTSATTPVLTASPTNSETRKKTYCNASTAGLLGARSVAATMTAAAAEATPAYQIVSVLPPTTHAGGNVSVSFALPADADGGDLFLQFTYNGVYVETVASVEITPGSEIPTVTVAGVGSAPAAATVRARLAATGTDSGALVGTALLLLLVGGALTVEQRARRRRRAA
jgi:hypothetical protein